MLDGESHHPGGSPVHTTADLKTAVAEFVANQQGLFTVTNLQGVSVSSSCESGSRRRGTHFSETLPGSYLVERESSNGQLIDALHARLSSIVEKTVLGKYTLGFLEDALGEMSVGVPFLELTANGDLSRMSIEFQRVAARPMAIYVLANSASGDPAAHCTAKPLRGRHLPHTQPRRRFRSKL